MNTHMHTHIVNMHIPVIGTSLDPMLSFSVLGKTQYCYQPCYQVIFTSSSVFLDWF